MNVQPTSPAGLAPAEDLFIPATVSLQSLPTRTLKHGDTFAVFDLTGDVLPSLGVPEGLYHRDTRHLSRYETLLNGARPILLSSTLRDDNATLNIDMTNPDLFDTDGNRVLERDVVHLHRWKFLWNGTCHERLTLRSFSEVPLDLELEVRFAADHADLFEVRGHRRTRRGQTEAPVVTADGVTLGYVGLDGVRRSTRLRFDPAPAEVGPGRALFRLHLPPRGHVVLFAEVACDQPDAPERSVHDHFILSMIEARQALRETASRAAAVETSNDVFNEALCRSVSDLYMLVTDKSTGPYPYAGVPWFSAPFGRDALITALLVLWLDPTIARGVLRYLAENQATETDPLADSEPGKILHEVRLGEMAELGEVPFRRYYGSVDSTPLFVMLAGEYLARTGDIDTLRALWPNIEAALSWIDHHGDRDGDGFVEYGRMSDTGLQNQGWKDSHDSVFHADGTMAEGPIALCEVQGYVFAARRAAAAIAWAMGDAARAEALEAQAEALRQAFEEKFWCEELGTYAIALDGRKRPCRVRSSNAGHLLMAGIAAPDRAELVAEGLMSGAFFTGWGIRTIASTEARYNPMSYHNGSVWPHDNALIALGFARYGFMDHVARLFQGLFDTSIYIDHRRLPELFCGFPRRRAQGPTFYPVACTPQAWAAAAHLGMLQACLGARFDPARRQVRFENPTLPPFLDQVTLHNLCLDGAQVSVRLRREGREVAMNVLDRAGALGATLVC